MEWIKKYRLECGVVALALIVRLALFGLSFHAGGNNLLDTISGADGYFTISQNILAGHGYSSASEPPYMLNSIRPPAQPYFLAGMAVLFGTYTGPLALQICMGSLIPLLGMMLARYLTPSSRVALATGIVLALEPLAALFSYIFYSETLFTFLFLLSVLCLCRYFEERRLELLGLSAAALGFAALTKPTAEYVPVLCVLAMGWHFRRALTRELPRMVLFLLVFLLVLSPWLLRNRDAFGVIALSPQLGEQLYAVLVPSVLSVNNGTTFADEVTGIIKNGGADPNQSSVSDSSRYFHEALPILAAHPKALTLVLGNTALNFFIHDGMFEVLKHTGHEPTTLLGKPALFLLLSDPGKLFSYIGAVLLQPTIFILFARLFWIAATALFFIGAIRYILRIRHTSGVFMIALVFYFMLTTLVIGLAVTGRYRLPVEAIIIAFAAWEAAERWRRIRPLLRRMHAPYISHA